METRTPTRHDDAISIARWEGEGGGRKSSAEEERDTRDAPSMPNQDNVRVPPPPRKAVTCRTIDVTSARWSPQRAIPKCSFTFATICGSVSLSVVSMPMVRSECAVERRRRSLSSSLASPGPKIKSSSASVS